MILEILTSSIDPGNHKEFPTPGVLLAPIRNGPVPAGMVVEPAVPMIPLPKLPIVVVSAYEKFTVPRL